MGLTKARYTRRFGNSPRYSFFCGDLAASASEVYEFESDNPPCAKYMPFNQATITNASTQPVLFYFNQDATNYFYIPAGTIFTFEPSEMSALWSFRITNQGTGAITTGQVILTYQKIAPATDEIARSLHKKAYLGGGY